MRVWKLKQRGLSDDWWWIPLKMANEGSRGVISASVSADDLLIEDHKRGRRLYGECTRDER